ncbi:MAG: hypothetical protein KDN18_25665 [Verrucomicrobiae bacterium]|nr:hypothetical protein [Verrucomicrobiae bacterium]
MTASVRWKRVIKNGWFWWLVALLVYSGFYANLRIRNVFIHRAGNYAAIPPYYAGKITNHFIEPGEIDEPELESSLLILNIEDYGSDPFADANAERLTKEEIEENLMEDQLIASARTVVDEYEHAAITRQRLFGVFIPAAFIETWFWKAIDPNPLRNRNQTSAEQIGAGKPNPVTS